MPNEIALAGERAIETPAPEPRSIQEITADAVRYQMAGADAVIGLGNCLIEAKAQLPHGEWLSWLSENLNLSDRVAQHLMLIARNCSNTNALSYLGKTKVLTILALPPEERALFLDADYIPEGSEKSVSEMTTRELQQVIRERDAANRERDIAQRQLKRSQENLQAANKQIDDICERLHATQKSEEEALAKASHAEESRLKMEEDMRLVNAELEELRNRPIDVAVQVQRDEAAIEKARQEVRAEMQSRLDEANAALDEANAAAKKAAESESALRQELSETRKAAERNAVTENAQIISDFTSYYNQTQELVNKMNGIVLKLSQKDPETAGKLNNALAALGDAIKKEAAV